MTTQYVMRRIEIESKIWCQYKDCWMYSAECVGVDCPYFVGNRGDCMGCYPIP